MSLINEIKDKLHKQYNYHKCLYNLENNFYINQPNNVNIHKTYDLNEPDINNILNMYHIENIHFNQNHIIPFGILSNKPSIYRNHTLLSFLHPNNTYLSNLYSTPINHINFISKYTYNIINTNNDTTINTNIIIITPQSYNLWIDSIKNIDMRTILIYNSNTLNRFKQNIRNINEIENYDCIIITINIWNKFAQFINQYNKFVKRIILDDFHLLISYKSLPIKYKFLWIVSDTLKELLTQNKKYFYWKDDFTNTCINSYNNEYDYLHMLNTLYNNQYSYLNDEYINTVGSDKDFVIYNFEQLIKTNNRRQMITWTTPYNIYMMSFIHEQYYKFKNGFFKDIFNSLLETSYNSKLYNNITSFKSIINKNNTYLIDVLYCLPLYSLDAKNSFLKTNIYNKEKYPYYFDCYDNVLSLLVTKENELNENKITLSEYERINKITHDCENNCPICFNNMDDELFLTSCCKNFIHYKCIFACFIRFMLCPLCKLHIQFHKSALVDSSLTNIIKLPTYTEQIINLITQDNKYILLLINDIDDEYFNLISNIKITHNYDIEVKLLRNNIQDAIKLDNLKKSGKKMVIVLLSNEIELFKSIDLSYIELFIVINSSLYCLELLEDQLINNNRTRDLFVKNLQNII
jgi:hypothetical protein